MKVMGGKVLMWLNETIDSITKKRLREMTYEKNFIDLC